MSQHDEHGDGPSAALRRKPFGAAWGAGQRALETAYRDRELGDLVAAGELDGARQRLFARLRAAPDDVAAYEDVIRLELAQGGTTWQSWLTRGLDACPELAPRLLASVPEDALQACGVRQMLPWNALRGQRDLRAAHQLFALRVGGLLWQGAPEDAFAAVVEPAFREHAERDPDARALMIAVLAAFAWRDAERMRLAAPLLSVSLPEPDPAQLPPYPLDALEHAVLLGEALRRASARAPCPPELLRALELGPFFGGAHARALLDELSASLRANPDDALRFCDAVVETSSALALHVAEAIMELSHETQGAAGPEDGDRPERTLEALARGEGRRRRAALLALGAGALGAAFFAQRGQPGLALAVGAPCALAAWALLGFFRDLAYVPRMRPGLARVLVQSARGSAELGRALARRPSLKWMARRAARDEALTLLGAIAARPVAAKAG